MSELEYILETLKRILPQILDDYFSNFQFPSNDKPLNIKEASEFTGYKVNSIYSMVNRREIPSHKNNGFLFFDREELRTWMVNEKNKQKTNKEIESEAVSRVVTERRGK